MSDFEFDLREFKACFEEVLKSGRKTAVQIVNRAGLVSIIGGKGVKGAIQLTPRASRGAIAALDKAKVAGFVANKLRRQGYRLVRSKAGNLVKGSGPGASGITSAQFDALVKKEINRRISSIAYTAGPGWNNAAKAFGGRGVRTQGGFTKSKAARGAGSKAQISRLVAEMENTAPMADAIGRAALQEGLNNASRDMIDFHRQKMAETLAKNSVR